MWVEDIERLAEELVARDGQLVSCRDLYFHILRLGLGSRPFLLRTAVRHAVKCIVVFLVEQLSDSRLHPHALRVTQPGNLLFQRPVEELNR